MVTLLWTAGTNWLTTIDIVHNCIETDDVDDDHPGNDTDIDIVNNRIETDDVDDDHGGNDGASDDNDDDQDHNYLDDAEER